MRIRPTIAVPLGLWLAIALAGCSGNNSKTVSDTAEPSQRGSVSTTAPPTDGTPTSTGTSAHVLRFDAATDVSCTGDTTTIQVVYETADLTAVSFIVDGQPAPGSVAPATSGSYPVSVPCDGNVHTIQLVGAGPTGPAFASKAVITRPA